MTSILASAIARLARDPLRNIVLLKHVRAFPEAIRVFEADVGACHATLVLMATDASPYDARTYPQTSHVAMIATAPAEGATSHDEEAAVGRVLAHVPARSGVVFKLASDAARAAILSRFDVRQTTSVLTFSTDAQGRLDPDVTITREPSETIWPLFERHDHKRAWLAPLLARDEAVTYAIASAGAVSSACFAFSAYGHIWEIGGVATHAACRRQGLAARVVATAVSDLAVHRRQPRYQVHDDNHASIALARRIGMRHVLTTTHLLRAPS